MTATEPRFCGLRATTSLPSSTRYFPSPRDARLVYSMLPGPRIGNVLTTYYHTRQPHRKLVRNVTVHLQPRTDSDHNIVCATVRLRDRLARNRKQRAPTGCKSMDRQAITSDTNWREGLIQRIASQLTQTEPEGIVGKKAAIFTDPLLQFAEEMIPNQSDRAVYLGQSRIR